jgi:hypothetical protein
MMLPDVCRRSTSSDRHAVDAFVPNIEPDPGKDLDALAEAKPHTQFSTTSENAASSGVGRATVAAKICFLSFMRFPHCKSTSRQPALGRAHAKPLLKTEDLAQRRQENSRKRTQRAQKQT